uniref:RH2 domain-containing protein n=2 Tax=Meloidogyne TaxID=189290 RepID=A0A915NU56_9BILA
MNDDGDGISLGADLTGNLVDPAEFASAVNDTFIGMGREVENLIRENTELLETKNALNIVKNDLIARLDQLSSEHAVYREEARSLELVKIKLIERIRGLEDELKELKEAKNQTETPEEDKAQGRRFTRLEMARVLMERNQYKENFFELQEAVKFTELQRARRTTSSNNQNKSIIWSFFSNLLGDSTSTSHIRQNVKKSQTKKNIPSSPLTQRKARSGGDKEDKTNQDRFNAERRQHYHEVSQHMKQEDFPTAYGWSIPSTKAAAQNLSIPVPVNCRPLIENASPSLKICCAASCSLHGGLSNGEYIVGDPILGCDPYLFLKNNFQRSNNENGGRKSIGEIKKLNGSEFSLLESSSLVWICSSSEIQKPFVTILDVNCPNSILEGFEINEIGARIFCIASVSGIHYSDIRITEEGLNSDSELCTRGGYFEKSKTLIESIMDFELFGSVEFIKLQLSTKKGEGEAIQTLIWEGQQKMTSPSKRRRDSSINESLQLNDTSIVNVEGLATRSSLLRQKTALHRNLAIPLQEDNINNNSEGDEFSKINFEEKKFGKNEQKIELFSEHKNKLGESQDPSPSPLDKLSLHIRNTLKRYEALPDEDILTLPLMWIGTESE